VAILRQVQTAVDPISIGFSEVQREMVNR